MLKRELRDELVAAGRADLSRAPAAQAAAARRARPVNPSSRSSSGASSGTGTAGREDADGPPLLGVRAHLVPDPLHQLGRAAPDRTPITRAMSWARTRPERVDLPEVLAHREVAERQMGRPRPGRVTAAGRGAGASDDGLEARHRVVAQQVAVELVRRRPRSMVRPASMSGTQASSIGVVVDELAQRRGLGAAPGGEGRAAGSCPTGRADLGHHPGQRPVGQHEDFGFGHRPLLGRISGHAGDVPQPTSRPPAVTAHRRPGRERAGPEAGTSHDHVREDRSPRRGAQRLGWGVTRR